MNSTRQVPPSRSNARNVEELMDHERNPSHDEIKCCVMAFKAGTFHSKPKRLGAQIFYLDRADIDGHLAQIGEMFAREPEATTDTLGAMFRIVKALGQSEVQYALPFLCRYEARRDDMSFHEVECLGFQLEQTKKETLLKLLRRPIEGSQLKARIDRFQRAPDDFVDAH
jgi:hypothetical protein